MMVEEDAGELSKRKPALVLVRLAFTSSNLLLSQTSGALSGAGEGVDGSSLGNAGFNGGQIVRRVRFFTICLIGDVWGITVTALILSVLLGANICLVIFNGSTGHMPTVLNAFWTFFHVKASMYGPLVATRNSPLLIGPEFTHAHSSI